MKRSRREYGFAFSNSFDSIDSSHEHGVVEDVRSHVLIDCLIYARTGVLQAGEILDLVPETAVVANVNQGIVEQIM